MQEKIKETFSLFLTESTYVNTFQFLTLNYRLYSANFWYDQCEENGYFFDVIKLNEYFPKLINFNELELSEWNENFLIMLKNNRALLETMYGNQNALVNIYDANGNMLQTTSILDAIENNLLNFVDYKTLNQPNPYTLPIKENKFSHDLTLIQIDLDGTYIELTSDIDELNDYIESLKVIKDKSIVVFNTQRAFFDTFDYMLYFLYRYKDGFYLSCDNGTSLYHFGYYKEHIVWSKIKNHNKNKMYLKAVKNNITSYNIVFDDHQYFDGKGIEDGKYQINKDWYISYYSNLLCNKTDLVEELIDEYYADRISVIINVDDEKNSTMFNINLKKSAPKVLNYSIFSPDENPHELKQKKKDVNFLEKTFDWIKKIEYSL